MVTAFIFYVAAILALFPPVPAGDRLTIKAATHQQTVTIALYFQPSPDNVWFCTQLKSLQEDWAPRHCGPVEPTEQFYADQWVNMPAGTYEVTAELFRDEKGGVVEYETETVQVVVG